MEIELNASEARKVNYLEDGINFGVEDGEIIVVENEAFLVVGGQSLGENLAFVELDSYEIRPYEYFEEGTELTVYPKKSVKIQSV